MDPSRSGALARPDRSSGDTQRSSQFTFGAHYDNLQASRALNLGRSKTLLSRELSTSCRTQLRVWPHPLLSFGPQFRPFDVVWSPGLRRPTSCQPLVGILDQRHTRPPKHRLVRLRWYSGPSKNQTASIDWSEYVMHGPRVGSRITGACRDDGSRCFAGSTGVCASGPVVRPVLRASPPG